MDSIEYFFVGLFFAMLLGVITGAIAQKKGESFLLWWLFGTLLFIIALPMVLLIKGSDRRVEFELWRWRRLIGGWCPSLYSSVRLNQHLCALEALILSEAQAQAPGRRRARLRGVTNRSMVPWQVHGGTRLLPVCPGGADGPSHYCERLCKSAGRSPEPVSAHC
jgi:hypothetical protein